MDEKRKLILVKSLEDAVKELTSLTERQRGDTESSMWKHGYHNVSPQDIIVYRYLGERTFHDLLETSIRYSCLEADYLNLEKKGRDFIRICTTNKQTMMDSVIQSLPHLIGREINFKPTSDEEMLAQIKRKYSKKSDSTLEIQ